MSELNWQELWDDIDIARKYMSERQKPWTPGPWHLDAEEGGELTGVDAEIASASDCEPFALSEYRICGATPYPNGKKRNRDTGEWEPLYPEIATVTFDPRREDADQHRVNARLIAAAPEMAKAMEEMLTVSTDGEYSDALWLMRRLLAEIYGETS